MSYTYQVVPTAKQIEQWQKEAWHKDTPVEISANDVRIAEEAAKWAFALAKEYYASAKPTAWMYPDEPDFDGVRWRENWRVTLDRLLAESQTRTPIPLFRLDISHGLHLSDHSDHQEGLCR